MSVGETNAKAWGHKRFVRHYRSAELRPAETQILSRYAGEFSGHVLEFGCGTGRATGHLAARSSRVEAIDLSPAMLAEARRRHPDVAFHLTDMSDLSGFDSGSFDAVIATCNVIDVLGDGERRALLGEVRRLLAKDGVFVFSSHNRGCAARLREPWQLPTNSLLSLAKSLVYLPMRMRNRRRLRPLVVRAPDYEILNDSAHDWRLLQYYVYPDDCRRQLADRGLLVLECLTLDGREVGDDLLPEESELYYVARRLK